MVAAVYSYLYVRHSNEASEFYIFQNKLKYHVWPIDFENKTKRFNKSIETIWYL